MLIRCPAGDDSIDITGHFYTIVEVYTSSNSIVIANNAVVGNEVCPTHIGSTLQLRMRQPPACGSLCHGVLHAHL